MRACSAGNSASHRATMRLLDWRPSSTFRALSQIYPHLTADQLARGFEFAGQRLPLVNRRMA